MEIAFKGPYGIHHGIADSDPPETLDSPPPSSKGAIDTRILELSLRAVSLQLEALVSECVDATGAPKTPSTKAIARARASLPPYCEHAFRKVRA